MSRRIKITRETEYMGPKRAQNCFDKEIPSVGEKPDENQAGVPTRVILNEILEKVSRMDAEISVIALNQKAIFNVTNGLVDATNLLIPVVSSSGSSIENLVDIITNEYSEEDVVCDDTNPCDLKNESKKTIFQEISDKNHKEYGDLVSYHTSRLFPVASGMLGTINFEREAPIKIMELILHYLIANSGKKITKKKINKFLGKLTVEDIL